ncbi:PorT protein [Formosa agariphila KMM 3901]|uniref:PorT protein n=1 Tax=Formosa agariphila (strain DSM 15362 / KCTC 12365 / LMG 23005 / KMM 3901 / M-2Alg 35-1) TaxID=1347342 RepID=T2KID4_FORAG|nr:porin family protein [Formosa agariphila]CDF78193.1 PorT protein [Formosa agariphila KMM 3901]
MKKLVVIVFFILISQSSFAQLFSRERILNNENFDKDRFSYGYFLGFNNYGFDFEYNEEINDENGRDVTDIQIEKSIGFSVGLLGNMRINDYFDLRFEPGLYITTRNLRYNKYHFQGYETTGTNGNNFTYDTYDFDEDPNGILDREVKSTYIHLPLLLKFSAKRINNFKPFIVGGLSMSLNLNSNEDNLEDNHSGQFRMTKHTYYYEIGAGIDFYLPYFKFTPSIRGVFAMNDELVRDYDPDSPWTGNISSMKTQGIFVNFTFQ